jgi:hypothetical protein
MRAQQSARRKEQTTGETRVERKKQRLTTRLGKAKVGQTVDWRADSREKRRASMTGLCLVSQKALRKATKSAGRKGERSAKRRAVLMEGRMAETLAVSKDETTADRKERQKVG